MKQFRTRFLFLILYSSALCQTSIVHPERERIPYIEKIESTTFSDISDIKLSEINSLFTDITLSSEIGLNHDLLLGSVKEADVYKTSEYIILDDRGKLVITVDKFGAIIRSGRGPGEYESPYSMELVGDNLFVADRSFLINRFTRIDNEFESSGDFKINVVPDQMCILGEKVFIRGAANDGDFRGNDNVIHVFDKQTLDYEQSIVDSYTAEGRIGQNELSEGQLYCDEATNSVLVSFDILPYVYSFSTTGQINWISEIDDFVSRTVIEDSGPNDRPSVTFKGDSIYDRITGLIELDENIALVQKLTMFPETENKFPVLKTYALDKSDGKISPIDTVPDNWILLVVTENEFIVNGGLMNIYNRN